MKTFVKVIARSEVKTSSNVKTSTGADAPFVTLTLAKDSIRLEAHPLTGEMLVVRGLPTTVTENQWLEPGTTSAGVELRRGLVADAQVGEHLPGDIIRAGGADGLEPYTGSQGSQYADKVYTNTNLLFLGEFDQDSPEFEARLEKSIEKFNESMVRQGRTAPVTA